MVLRWDVNQEDIASALKDAGASYTFIDRQDYAKVLKELEAASGFGANHTYVDDQDISEFINQQEGGLGGSIPAPTLDLDLTNPATASLLTTVRNSAAWADNVDGVWTQFSANIPRITNKGLLVEEARTNSIRNNSMQGGAPGTPGTYPTGWGMAGHAELTTSLAFGTQDGMEYCDLRIVGTVTAPRSINVSMGGITDVAAANAQAWTQSVFMRRSGGSEANVARIALVLNAYNSSSIFLNQPLDAQKQPLSTDSLGKSRVSASATLSGATIAFIRPYIVLTTAAAGPVDITIRIGWPQLELGAFVTSPIRTTTVAVARAVDDIVMADISWLNPNEGTIYSEYVAPSGVNAGQFPEFGLTLRTATNNTQNTIEFFFNTSTLQAAFLVRSGNVIQANPIRSAALVSGNIYRAAGAYAVNNFAASFDGAAVLTDVNGTLPGPLTRVNIHGAGNQAWNSRIRRVRYWNTRRPNNELRVMTS